MPLLAVALALFAFFAAPGAAWALRRPERRDEWDALLFVVPFLAWLSMALIRMDDKSLSNIAGEPLYLGLVMSAFYCGRRLLTSTQHVRLAAIVTSTLGVCAGLALGGLTRAWPE